MTTGWRLLFSGPGSAAWNMAVDEAILFHHSRGQSPPTLRFYRWQPAAVSLGRFQDPDTAIDRAACRALGLDWVRRPTGGRAVLHDREATYSVVVSQRLLPGSVLETYRTLSQGLLGGLAALGVRAELVVVEAGRRGGGTAACFDVPSRHEIAVHGRKIAGGAQVRRHGAILQHGSIPIELDAERLAAILCPPRGKDRSEMATLLERKATCLQEVLGYAPAIEAVEEALAGGFAALGWRLVPGGLTPEEEATARCLLVARPVVL